MSTKNLRLGLIGKKLGMTTVFDESGARHGVTVIEVEKNVVLQRKAPETDGYAAVQVGYGTKRPKLVRKPNAGHFLKAGLDPERFPRYVKEIRLSADEAAKFSVGQEIPLTFFAAGDVVDVSGISKGRGFQGVMKRHHFGGFPASHGTHEYFRHPGSIGCRTTPGRVHKGKRMAGQMGGERVTIQNLTVVGVDPEKRLLFVKGAVPGARGTLVYVRGAVKRPAKAFEVAAPAAG
jgi:large subunit ribosomal protein L3